MKGRIFIFYLIFLVTFGVLVSRLFYLNLVRGEEGRRLSEGQRIRLRKIPAPRGIIFDRNGQALVSNVPVYKVCDAFFNCRRISREEALSLEGQGKEADLVIEVGRDYPLAEILSGVLGYLGEATAEEVEEGKQKLGDLVGRTGIEEKYDFLLRGVEGGQLLEVDATGVTLRKIGEKEPVVGQDLFLTIDLVLQREAFEALEGRKGAVVAQNPKTGEVLALVSSPSFHPDFLIEALDDLRQPLFNRAISGSYPAGSTFKIVTSAAGLEEGKIKAETKIEDKGQIVVGSYVYANWYFTQHGKTEGEINLVRAIKRSTNTFFYKVGELVGAQKLVEWAKVFGFGKKTGIDLPGETGGFLPDPSVGRWYLGNTYHLAIGEGYLRVTPLQVNQQTAVIASGGKLCRPYLLKNQEPQCQEVGLRQETIRLIRQGLEEACLPGGTAFPFFDFEISGLPANESQHEPYTNSTEKASAKTGRVACKTGTAEFGHPAGKTHAWFTAFAPADDPEIVVTSLIEEGGEGSSVAAPVVKKVMEAWFHSK